MNRSQKIVVLLLVVAILFSGVSIFVSYIALNVDIPKTTSGNVVRDEGGGISLVVEGGPPGGEAG